MTGPNDRQRDRTKNRPRTHREPAQEHRGGLVAARERACQPPVDGEAILRKYKYPTDQADAAVELVMQQAEAWGESWM